MDHTNKLTVAWYLEGILGNGKTWIIPIDKFPFLIGRSDDCHLVLSSEDISRNHAQIILDKNNLVIRDLKSTNGTFVNHNRIKNKAVLKSRDTVFFGNIKFRIYLKDKDRAEEDEPLTTLYSSSLNNAVNFVRYYDLTKREEEILFHLLDGKATKSIAETLFISMGTAKNHVLKIFKKTGVHSRFELLTLYNNFQATKK